MPKFSLRRRGGRKGEAPTTDPAPKRGIKLATPQAPKVKPSPQQRHDARILSEAIVTQHEKLVRRARWLERKAMQLPKNSNGRKRVEAEREVIFQMIGHLFTLRAEPGRQEKAA